MKYVYIHRNRHSLEPFYIGIGNKKRAYDFNSRSNAWKNYIQLNGKPIVEIFCATETIKDAEKIEIDLIKKYGRKDLNNGNLINGNNGGIGGSKNPRIVSKMILDTETGIYYDSIKEAFHAKCCSTYVMQMLHGFVKNRTSLILI